MLKNYSKKLQKFIKNLNSDQKKYIGIGLVLFFVQYLFSQPSDYDLIKVDITYISIFSIVGIYFSIKRRNDARKLINDKPLTSIVLNDYTFSSYASLSILSLIFALFQGILLGATFGFIFYSIGHFYSEDYFFGNLGYAISSLFILIIIRVIIEAFTLIFRVAEDISKAVNKQNI